MNKEIVMNPDILPTQKEWRLICKMVKQQQAEISCLKNKYNKLSNVSLNLCNIVDKVVINE